jgi:pimeloyl-ACP methyl ester carboxylesterase
MPDPTATLRRPSALTAIGVALALTACGGPPPPLNNPAMMEPMRGEVDAASLGLRIAYASGGDPLGLPVILVHGTPGSAGGWVDYVVDPVPGTRTIALDRPGFGRTVPPDARIRLADQADAVLALAPPDRPVILVGHSLGGPIVAWAAAAHPERVAALVLLAASLDPDLESVHPLQPVGEWWPVRALLPSALRNANLELMGLRAELDLLRDRLGDIRCPIVIVHGTDDDLVPYANVPYMVAKLSGARSRAVVTLDRGNHFLPWNAQAEVRAAIAQAMTMARAP